MTLVGPSGKSANETHTHKFGKYKLTKIPPPSNHWLALETGFDQPNHIAKLVIKSLSCTVEKRLNVIEAPC